MRAEVTWLKTALEIIPAGGSVGAEEAVEIGLADRLGEGAPKAAGLAYARDLVADGAANGKYGEAIRIYTAIQKVSKKADAGVLQRLALAISLEHAVPIRQGNPKARTDAPETIDPVKRYLHYEKAYLDGELAHAAHEVDRHRGHRAGNDVHRERRADGEQRPPRNPGTC